MPSWNHFVINYALKTTTLSELRIEVRRDVQARIYKAIIYLSRFHYFSVSPIPTQILYKGQAKYDLIFFRRLEIIYLFGNASRPEET